VERVTTQVDQLSGGERARLLINLIALNAPHLILLDEPTNHLDIDSRHALLDALNDYEGAVVVITHDRALMEMVADRLWLTASGTVSPFDGDMEDYAKFVLDRARAAAKAPAKPIAAPEHIPALRPTAATAPLKRRLEAAEAALARETTLLAELDAALADPALHAHEAAEAARLAERRIRLAERLTKAEAAWLAAAEAYEESADAPTSSI
jgi:ATP-binding cassette subfamily F protein 3